MNIWGLQIHREAKSWHATNDQVLPSSV